jgi:CRP/FNR family nitrogen fixation transcriptional regulator
MSTQLAASLDRASSIAPAVAARASWQAAPTVDRRGLDGELSATGAVLHFAHDREIYGEGDGAEVFFKVVAGVVRTCKFLSDGRRQIEAFHVTGELFGFEAGEEHRLSAEAVCDCTVIAYRRRGIERLAVSNDALARQLFSYAMRSMTRAQDHSLLLGRKSALEKVAAFLLECAQHSSDGRTVSLAMSRQDIADYLGLTIETVSRTLSQLERDAVIALPSAREIRFKNPTALHELNA